MNVINESELADFVRNKAVKRLKIAQHENGKYRLAVNLTWKEGDWHLVTTRRTPREFASLDRLVNLIQRDWGGIPAISLSLFQALETEKTRNEIHH